MIAPAFSSLFSTSSLWFWESLEIVGAIIVIVGVWGEFWAEKGIIRESPNDLMPLEFKREKYEGIFWRILLSGLAIELIGVVFALILSNTEIEELHKANLVLQAKLQPRTITPMQVKDFIFLTEKISKDFPIKICVGQADEETESYAYQIRQMLNQAGFKMDSSAGLFGITRHPNFRQATPIGTNEEATVYFVTSDTNFVGQVLYQLQSEPFRTNGFRRPISIAKTPEEICQDIENSLNQLKIETNYLLDTNSTFVKPGVLYPHGRI